ncbi:MAG: TIGR03435 family protein [Acidobacteriota bacterium]
MSIRRICTATAVGLISTIGALAQTGPRLTFEVAVIKVPAPTAQNSSAATGIKVTAQQVTVGRTSLLRLTEIAYGIGNAHIEGPAWLRNPQSANDVRLFDIAAKLPPGATPAQVPQMLQALLENRFKLTARKTSKLADTYALVVGKNGPKFPKKEPSGDQPSNLDFTSGPNGMQIMGVKISAGANGGTRMEASSPSGLIEILSKAVLPTPVIDKTGLNGSYDIKFEIPPFDRNLSSADGSIAPADLQEWTRISLFAAMEKIGLKMEKQKNPVETLVIDHLEKAPTEN